MASFNDLAMLSQLISETRSRSQIIQTVADFLASLSPAETADAGRFITGRALALETSGSLNLSGRAVWRVVAEAAGTEPDREEIFAQAVDFGEAVEMAIRRRSAQPPSTLAITEVASRLAAIASIEGRQSRTRKLDAMRELFELTTNMEAKVLARIIVGEMRHGISEGLMIEALAAMAGRSDSEVRRLQMIEGDVGRVAAILRGANTETPLTAERMKPLKPMLAQPAADVAQAFDLLGSQFMLEHKIDGARVQIHHAGDRVRIFSRRFNDITSSLPEVVEMTAGLGKRDAILDGEAVAVDESGRPLAFQELMRRFRRIREVERLRSERPVRLFLFDLIGLDGELLIDRPYCERIALLTNLAAAAGLEMVGRTVPSSIDQARYFFAQALAAGYEGVMAKALDSHYAPGARGGGWLKIKRSQSLDLVIVAADWGYGRRHGWLSNYHLAARASAPGAFVEVGKTFKGLTDQQFREMTERLLALETARRGATVVVKPRVVVEVAYTNIQRSSSYECGMTLRFARIVRVRDDKSPDEADPLERIAVEFSAQADRSPANIRSQSSGYR